MDRPRKAARFNASAPIKKTPPSPPLKAASATPPAAKRQKVADWRYSSSCSKVSYLDLRSRRVAFPPKSQADPRARDKGVMPAGKKGGKGQAGTVPHTADQGTADPWVIEPFRRDGMQLGKEVSVFSDREACLAIARSIASPADELKLAEADPDEMFDTTSALLVKVCRYLIYAILFCFSSYH